MTYHTQADAAVAPTGEIELVTPARWMGTQRTRESEEDTSKRMLSKTITSKRRERYVQGKVVALAVCGGQK